jgi:hypothetical protein
MHTLASTFVTEVARPNLPLRILALAPNDWDGQWMNRQQILSRLAQKHGVIYSNGPWRVWDRVKATFWACPWFGAFVCRDGVWVDRSPRLLIGWRPGRLDRWVQHLVNRRWRRQLARLGHGPTVIHVFHPAFASAAQGVPHDLLVYHPYDLFRHQPGWTPAMAEQERRRRIWPAGCR